jgi:hypothetical protein
MLKNALVIKKGRYLFLLRRAKLRKNMRRCSNMLFSSIIFIFYFLPVVLAAVFHLTPKTLPDIRNIILLAASLFFYSWGEPVYVFLMIYSAFLQLFHGP